mmetsp:Transcript_64820/g.130351  ORF Transcript_64820/g.130351 Transcript_64820/m.130351 type:complete len:122 (-) Transcript_64820:507-872(-)
MGVLGDAATFLVIAPKVAMYWLMINFLDYAPGAMRRRILSGEYEGEALERRLQMQIGGGWRMAKALYRMSSINLRPAVAEGDLIPSGINLVPVKEDGCMVDLASLTRGHKRPLVINFGSCS